MNTQDSDQNKSEGGGKSDDQNKSEGGGIGGDPERAGKKAEEQDFGEPERAGQLAEKPEITDEAKEKAKKMAAAYEDKKTVVLPGSDNTVTGTAVNDWLDDEGNPIHGKEGDGGKEGRDKEGNQGQEAEAREKADSRSSDQS